MVGPFALNLLRVGFSLLLFWLAWLFGKQSAGISRKHLGRFILCGISGVALNQMFFIKGLTMTSTIHASLLILATPLLVTIFAWWVLKEQLTAFKAIGLSLGIGGATLLVLQKESGPYVSDHFVGDVLILLNSISYAVYFILVKPLMKSYSPLHVVRWVFTLGFPLMIPFGWNETSSINWNAFDAGHLAALGSVVIPGTFLAYYFNAYGIQHLGAGTTGSYIYTQPVFAVIIATLFLHESFTWQKLLAAALIFSGVFLVSLRGKNPRGRAI